MQKSAYEMRISYWSSDVCSSDLQLQLATLDRLGLESRSGTLLSGNEKIETAARKGQVRLLLHASHAGEDGRKKLAQAWRVGEDDEGSGREGLVLPVDRGRSEEHTSELQSLMRTSYAVFCSQKKMSTDSAGTKDCIKTQR